MPAARLAALALVPSLAGCQCGPPPAPDYSKPESWAALPSTKDPADRVPEAPSLPAAAREGLADGQAAAKADAFYVHPTTYLYAISAKNASLDDSGINHATDDVVQYQATVFNGAARVFAPRYRQASVISYSEDDGDGNEEVLDLAYSDVKAAFQRYLDDNPDRPFVLAGHSQGSAHLVRLLQEVIDGKPLAKRLVAAYVIGELVGADTFRSLPVCATPTSTRCIVSWATVAKGATPQYACGSEKLSKCIPSTVHTKSGPATCVNPITFLAGGAAPASKNLGAGPGRGVDGGSFEGFSPGLVDAACDATGLLRIDDTLSVGGVRASDFAGVDAGDYHAQDYNLFYLNLRANVKQRIDAYRG